MISISNITGLAVRRYCFARTSGSRSMTWISTYNVNSSAQTETRHSPVMQRVRVKKWLKWRQGLLGFSEIVCELLFCEEEFAVLSLGITRLSFWLTVDTPYVRSRLFQWRRLNLRFLSFLKMCALTWQSYVISIWTRSSISVTNDWRSTKRHPVVCQNRLI